MMGTFAAVGRVSSNSVAAIFFQLNARKIKPTIVAVW